MRTLIVQASPGLASPRPIPQPGKLGQSSGNTTQVKNPFTGSSTGVTSGAFGATLPDAYQFNAPTATATGPSSGRKQLAIDPQLANQSESSVPMTRLGRRIRTGAAPTPTSGRTPVDLGPNPFTLEPTEPAFSSDHGDKSTKRATQTASGAQNADTTSEGGRTQNFQKPGDGRLSTPDKPQNGQSTSN